MQNKKKNMKRKMMSSILGSYRKKMALNGQAIWKLMKKRIYIM